MAEIGLKEFLLKLHQNYQILREREAKYATAAPLDLLNQLDDYARAIGLTEQAMAQDIPLEDLQAEFRGFNLQIDTVVFIAKEPPRKPFTGRNPYRGLRKFTEAEAEYFFGREAAIQQLLDTLQHLIKTETSPQEPDLIPVLGGSGSGKSSLVRAGVIPALWQGRLPGSEAWPVKVMVPGPHPLEALAEIFVGQIGRGLAAIRQEFEASEKALHYLMVEALAGKPKDDYYILVIDQFEEVFTLCEDETERRTFLNQILYASQTRNNRGFIFLTMRADFYAKAGVYKDLAEAITRNQMLVSPMTEKELREAILLPAEAVGLELEKDLVQALVQDTFEAPGTLPLLQHALQELFERRDGNLLTMQAYQEIGGIKGAIAHRADSIMNDLTPGQRVLARRIFMRLIQPGEGAADTRRRASLEEVLPRTGQTAEVENIIQTLTNSNLVVTSLSPETSQIVLDVSHEALIREWPTLRRWLDEDRQGLRIRQQLSRAALDWQERQRGDDNLYRGARLLEAEEWVAVNPDEINALEQEFLKTSRTRLQAEQRQVTLRRVIIGTLAVVALVTIAGALFAFNQQQLTEAQRVKAVTAEAEANLARSTAVVAKDLAEERRGIAEQAQATAVAAKAETERLSRVIRSGQLGAEALNVLQQYPDRAPLLALEAINVTRAVGEGRVVVAEQALRDTLRQTGGQPLIGHTGPIRALAFSPDGHWLATAGDDKLIRVWSLDNVTTAPVVLQGHPDKVLALIFSPDNTWLATADSAGYALVWRVANWPAQPEIGLAHSQLIRALAFSPDSQWLATASDDGTAQLLEVNKRTAQPVTLPGHNNFVRTVAFSSDSRWLATGGEDRTVRLWSVKQPEKEVRVLDNFFDKVVLVKFSPQGRWLAAASADGLVQLWETDRLFEAKADQAQIESESLSGHTLEIKALAFTPDEQWLATGSGDKTVRLWPLAKPQANPVVLRAHTSGVNSLAFSSDGQWLVTASGDTIQPSDNTARVWNMADLVKGDLARAERAILRGHESGVNGVAFSRDNHWLATGSEDHLVRLWDFVDPAFDPVVVRGQRDAIEAISYSPDGRWLASGGDNGQLRLWPLEINERAGSAYKSPLAPLDLGSPGARIRAVAFSPDGRWLAAASSDGTVQIWNPADPQADPVSLAGHAGPVIDVAFDPQGHWLATGGADSTAQLWDVSSLSSQPPTKSISLPHAESVGALAFSPDGHWLATGSFDDQVRLWAVDRATIEPAQILTGHTASVDTLAFSAACATPEGCRQWLASGSDDGTVRLWDVSALLKNETGSAPIPSTVLRGHDVFVSSVAFSADGHWLASGSADRTIRLWDLTNLAAEPVILRGHTDFVSGVAFSPDGRWLGSGSGDATIRLWRVGLDDLLPIACASAGRNFRYPDEWQQYFPDQAYRRTCPDWPANPNPDFHLQIITLAQNGQVEAALSTYQKALAEDRELVSLEASNLLCWYGSLWKKANEVADACQTAISLAPTDGNFHDSRGINRALRGDVAGAIDDFQYYVAWLQENNLYEAGEGDLRQSWIEQLRAGQNPFEEATLEQLKSQ